MIPQAYITEWSQQVPWQTNEQVEQDLVICRALVEIFSDKWLADSLAFRRVGLSINVELFNYFITPFAMTGNKIEIEVRFKIISNTGSPIDESKQQYKSAKEAAKQLGLKFDEEL